VYGCRGAHTYYLYHQQELKYAHTHAYVSKNSHTHIHARMSARTHICTYTRVCQQELTYAHTRAYISKNSYMHIHVRMSARTQELTYAHTRAYVSKNSHTRAHAIHVSPRLRNFLNAEDHDLFDTISEYTAPPDVTAARSRFYHRRVKMLMYTERAHFYHRHRVRGIRVCACVTCFW